MIKQLTLSLTCLVIAIGCASKKEEPVTSANASANQSMVNAGPSIEAKQVAAQHETTHVAEITFKKASSELSAANKAKIEAVLKQAEAHGPLKNIQVITWADAEYPSVHTKKLSKTERELVDRRNQTIKNFLNQKNKDVEVKLHSMAERPGSLTNLLGASGSELKKSFEVSGVPNTDSSVKTPSKASHSVLIIEMK